MVIVDQACVELQFLHCRARYGFAGDQTACSACEVIVLTPLRFPTPRRLKTKRPVPDSVIIQSEARSLWLHVQSASGTLSHHY